MDNFNSFCEYFCNNKYSMFFNIASTLIGAFLGFLFALILYWKSERKKRKDVKHADKIKAFNTLQRFSLILSSVIKISEQQSNLFKLHTNDLRAKPLNYHFPQIPATNDRVRLVESDTFELFHSFMLFDKKNPNKFKDYKNIFNHSDFLQKYFDDLYTQNEKHQNFLHSDLKIIKDNLLFITLKIGLLQNDIELKNPNGYKNDPEYSFLEKYKNIYISLKGTGFSDFEPYKDQFLVPLNIELLQSKSQQGIFNDIAYPIADSITRMDNLVLNTIEHANNLNNIENNQSVKSAIDYLQKMLDRIKKINEP